jgi:hypothetical protein
MIEPILGRFYFTHGADIMFLSSNDNLAPWFKQFLWAHSMAPRHVRPAMSYDLRPVNKNRNPIRV